MKRLGIDRFHVSLKSALRIPKSAILPCALLFALSVPAQAQQQTKAHKIGWLGTGSAPGPSGRSEGMRRELRELGYVDGKNIAFEDRYAEGNLDRLPVFAHELVRLKVDVLYTSSTPNARALKSATGTITIVFVIAGDPVVAGLVDSLARPGGNITGFTTISPVIVGKRLELLKETVPKVSRVAVLWSLKGSAQQWTEIQLPRENWVCSFIRWRLAAPTNTKAHSKKHLRRGAMLSSWGEVRWTLLTRNGSPTWRRSIACRRYILGEIISPAEA